MQPRTSLATSLFVALLAITTASAQPDSVRGGMPVRFAFEDTMWLTLGIGGATAGLAVGGALTRMQTEHTAFTIQVINATEFSFCLGGCLGESARETQLGLLYGLIDKGEGSYTAISAGLGVAWGIRSSSGSAPRFVAPALLVDAQLFSTLSDVFGIGLYFFANLNAVEPMAGCLLSLQLGALR